MTEPPGVVWNCEVCGQEAGRIVRRDGFAFVELEIGVARLLVAETDGLRCVCGAPLTWHYDARLKDAAEFVREYRRGWDEIERDLRNVRRELAEMWDAARAQIEGGDMGG